MEKCMQPIGCFRHGIPRYIPVSVHYFICLQHIARQVIALSAFVGVRVGLAPCLNKLVLHFKLELAWGKSISRQTGYRLRRQGKLKAGCAIGAIWSLKWWPVRSCEFF